MSRAHCPKFSPGWLAFAACLVSCGTLKLNPKHVSATEYDCFSGSGDPRNPHSRLEEELRRSGPLESKRIRLASGVGMIEKTARLYVVDGREFILALHFLHSIDLEIEDYAFTLGDGSRTIAAGTLRIDTRHTIGEVTEEHLYHPLSRAEAEALAAAQGVIMRVGDLAFEIPYRCRETFREVLRAR